MIPKYSYNEARQKIKNGDIIYLWKPPFGEWKNWRAIVFPLVSFFTGSPIYHCGIAVWMKQPNGSNRLMIAESNLQGGKKILPLSYYAPRKMEVHALPEHASFKKMEIGLMNNIGRQPYSLWGFIAVGVREYFGIRPHDYDGQICSELCAQAWIEGGMQLPETLVSPGKLRGELIRLGVPIAFETIPCDSLRED